MPGCMGVNGGRQPDRLQAWTVDCIRNHTCVPQARRGQGQGDGASCGHPTAARRVVWGVKGAWYRGREGRGGG
jgi:hypothetical protein